MRMLTSCIIFIGKNHHYHSSPASSWGGSGSKSLTLSKIAPYSLNSAFYVIQYMAILYVCIYV